MLNKINKLVLIILIFFIVFFITWVNVFYSNDLNNLNNLNKKERENYRIKVYVCGNVEKPGVYEVNYNSRVCDLLPLVGVKPDTDLDNINLAKRLKDEDFIRFYKKDFNNIYININKANVDELTKLPGISKKTALNIIEYREKYGNFTNISELIKVKGITIEDLEILKKYITF